MTIWYMVYKTYMVYKAYFNLFVNVINLICAMFVIKLELIEKIELRCAGSVLALSFFLSTSRERNDSFPAALILVFSFDSS